MRNEEKLSCRAIVDSRFHGRDGVFVCLAEVRAQAFLVLIQSAKCSGRLIDERCEQLRRFPVFDERRALA